MRVCFVHEEYPEETNFGGIATYQKVTAEELVRQGHEVYVICRGLKQDSEYKENGVNIFRVHVPKTNNQVSDYKKYRKKVSNILKQLQKNNLIDIIEVPDWGAETVLFEKLREVPLVVRLHTPLKVWLKYNKNNFGKITNKMLYWENKMIKSADLLTCCSNALKEMIVDDFKINESKILVTPNSANITNFYRNEKIAKEDKIIFVGSLEERKGVCVLAQALNIVFEKYPNLKIEFIGKDTNRNNQNISTIELIYKIVDEKYKDNLKFIGQIPNYKLNDYLNSSKVAVFPSLFDNFPYVVLEAMATGLHIVGSKNSGMVEMLNDDSSIYETGNYQDLAFKIIEKYELSLNQEINESNINRVKTAYSASNVCKELIKLYEDTINKYNAKIVNVEELQTILNNVTNEKIISYKRESGGVANLVFKVKTQKNTYIIKKYFNNYDFELSYNLFSKYEKEGIKFAKSINSNVITYNSYKYNIFNYIEGNSILKINESILEKLICCERKTEKNPTISEKCNKYYEYLINQKEFADIKKEEVEFVLAIFEKVKDIDIINEKYLNHGDISTSNVIKTKKEFYIIDFDEVTVTTPLYDFAVIIIKNFVKDDKLDLKKYQSFKEKIKKHYLNYTDVDYDNILKYYLCKILIEKFYLHSTKQIDLFSKRQMNDNYKKYLNILKQIEYMGCDKNEL